MVSMDCYTEQVRRLKDTFGDKNYPKERQTLFFREVSKYTDDLLIRAVDKLIYEEKHPPMPPKIIETLLDIQASDLEHRKIEFTGSELQDAAKFSHNPEFASLCLGVIAGVTTGKMSRDEYNDAMKYIDTYCDELDTAGRQNFCKDCGNQGYAFKEDGNGYCYLFRCSCSHGHKKPHSTRYKDANGEVKEVKIPVLRNEEKWWDT